MDSFESAVRKILREEEPVEDQPNLNGEDDKKKRNSVSLEAILLRWEDDSITSIKGPLLVRYLNFLEYVSKRIPGKMKGGILPKTPDDYFIRMEGWITPEGD